MKLETALEEAIKALYRRQEELTRQLQSANRSDFPNFKQYIAEEYNRALEAEKKINDFYILLTGKYFCVHEGCEEDHEL